MTVLRDVDILMKALEMGMFGEELKAAWAGRDPEELQAWIDEQLEAMKK